MKILPTSQWMEQQRIGSLLFFFFFFLLHWVFVSERRVSLLMVCRLLTAVVSLAAKHRLQSMGSVVVAHGLSCL